MRRPAVHVNGRVLQLNAVTLCRVPEARTRRTLLFAVCLGAAHGDVMATLTARGRRVLCRVLELGTRQR